MKNLRAGSRFIIQPPITRISRILFFARPSGRGGSPEPPRRLRSIAPSSRGGFALVITLVMVALLAIIAIGVLTSVSLERVTAKSYEDRYQAELAVQNGLEAAKQTLVTTPFPSPVPSSSP